MTSLSKILFLRTVGQAILVTAAMQSAALAVVISPGGAGTLGIVNYQAGNVALQSNGSIATFVAPTVTGFGGTPDRGNDGNTNSAYAGNSVFHSNSPAIGERWRVTMNAEYAISNVRIYNRDDGIGARFTVFDLVKTNPLGSITQTLNHGGVVPPVNYAQPNNTIVKSLDIVQGTNEFFALAEVELDGQSNLTLGSDSLQIEVSNLGNDFVDVDGNAVLNGNVNLLFLGGFVPANPINILTAANINTANMVLTGSNTTVGFRILNGGNGQILQVFATPEPLSIAVWLLIGGGAVGVAVARRKRR